MMEVPAARATKPRTQALCPSSDRSHAWRVSWTIHGSRATFDPGMRNMTRWVSDDVEILHCHDCGCSEFSYTAMETCTKTWVAPLPLYVEVPNGD